MNKISEVCIAKIVLLRVSQAVYRNTNRIVTKCIVTPLVIILISLLNKNLIFIRKTKDASPNCMITIEIMWERRWNLYYSPSNHVPFTNFNMAVADAIINFLANSKTEKYDIIDMMFYFTQNWFLCIYIGIVHVISKFGFIALFHHSRPLPAHVFWGFFPPVSLLFLPSSRGGQRRRAGKRQQRQT